MVRTVVVKSAVVDDLRRIIDRIGEIEQSVKRDDPPMEILHQMIACRRAVHRQAGRVCAAHFTEELQRILEAPGSAQPDLIDALIGAWPAHFR